MSRTVTETLPIPSFVKDLSASSYVGTVGDGTHHRGAELFERFGIYGNCLVVGRRGVTPLADLRANDEILTRRHGWVPTLCMMIHAAKTETERVPLATFVSDGCLGNGLPQGDLALGANNLVTRYVVPSKARRPSSISMQLSATGFRAAMEKCSVDKLCIPVFHERMEIMVQGIYVVCPGTADLEVRSTAHARP